MLPACVSFLPVGLIRVAICSGIAHVSHHSNLCPTIGETAVIKIRTWILNQAKRAALAKLGSEVQIGE